MSASFSHFFHKRFSVKYPDFDYINVKININMYIIHPQLQMLQQLTRELHGMYSYSAAKGYIIDWNPQSNCKRWGKVVSSSLHPCYLYIDLVQCFPILALGTQKDGWNYRWGQLGLSITSEGPFKQTKIVLQIVVTTTRKQLQVFCGVN